MSRLVKVIYLFLSLLVATTTYAVTLTEATVKQVISRVDNAIVDLNANALSKELSNSVSITINISIKGHKQIMKVSKQEYISLLEEGWAEYSNYQYSRSNMVIKIRENKAFVSALVQESMTVQGQIISGFSREVVTIELVNGTPLITEVVGYTGM